MRNISENIYKYFCKDISLINLAYEGVSRFFVKALLVILMILLILPNIIYIFNYNSRIMIVLLLDVTLILLIVKLLIKRANNKGKTRINFSKLNFNKLQLEYFDVKTILIVKYIYDENLLNKEGLSYLINIYSNKAKNKYIAGIAVGAIILNSIIQSLIDLYINGDKENQNRISDFCSQVFFSKEMTIIIIIFFAILLITTKSILKSLHSIINMKSNNYKVLSELFHERLLPLVIIFENQTNNSHQVYEKVIESIYYELSKKDIKRKSIKVKKPKKKKVLHTAINIKNKQTG